MDRTEQEKIDLKQQEYPNVGDAANNDPIEPIIWGGDVKECEKVILPKAVDRLLIICQNMNYYAVMNIIPKEHSILVWDAAAESP